MLRAIGIVSMLILARLLTPEDFGIVAIATMVVFFCDVLTESGAQQYIVQKETVDDKDLNSSWTLNLALKSIVCILFILSTPLIETFFDRTDLAQPLQIIALILPLGALMNPGLHLLKKEFNYRPIMRLLVAEKILSFIFTVSMAFYFENYWAMIWGVVLSYLFKTIGSYFIHEYRPKFDACRIKEQWGFSKWMLFKSILGYSKAQLDTLFISKLFSFEALGGFSLMKNLSIMPALELIKPLTEPLLASFSKVKSDPDKLNYQISYSLCILFMGTAPISTFLWNYDELIVQLLFDDRWWQYAPILGIMSVLIVNFSFVSIFQEALIALNKVKILFYYDLVSVVLIVATLLLLTFESIEQFALVRAVLAIGSVFILTVTITYILKLNLYRIAVLITPTCLSCVLSIWLISNIEIYSEWPLFLNLLATGLSFVVSYVVFVIVGYQLLSARQETKELKKLIGYLYKQVIKSRKTDGTQYEK